LLGDDLENAGWRQGSIIRLGDVSALLDKDPDENLYLIVGSQSCDIANNNLASDPHLEVSIARSIPTLNGNYTFNKNPRIHHTTLLSEGPIPASITKLYVEINAYEKVFIDKQKFSNLEPDKKISLTVNELHHYVQWLGARYTRPALPTEFNNRLIASSEDNKKIAKKVAKELSGIYVEIIPDREIAVDEKYTVHLLGLVSADFENNIEEIKEKLEPLKGMMEKANMEVKLFVRKEDEVSVAMIKRFKRFYYDDISFRKKAVEPTETVVIL